MSAEAHENGNELDKALYSFMGCCSNGTGQSPVSLLLFLNDAAGTSVLGCTVAVEFVLTVCSRGLAVAALDGKGREGGRSSAGLGDRKTMAAAAMAFFASAFLFLGKNFFVVFNSYNSTE